MQCKKNDPNLDGCLMTGLQSAVPHLAKGKSKYNFNTEYIYPFLGSKWNNEYNILLPQRHVY